MLHFLLVLFCVVKCRNSEYCKAKYNYADCHESVCRYTECHDSEYHDVKCHYAESSHAEKCCAQYYIFSLYWATLC